MTPSGKGEEPLKSMVDGGLRGGARSGREVELHILINGEKWCGFGVRRFEDVTKEVVHLDGRLHHPW